MQFYWSLIFKVSKYDNVCPLQRGSSKVFCGKHFQTTMNEKFAGIKPTEGCHVSQYSWSGYLGSGLCCVRTADGWPKERWANIIKTTWALDGGAKRTRRIASRTKTFNNTNGCAPLCHLPSSFVVILTSIFGGNNNQFRIRPIVDRNEECSSISLHHRSLYLFIRDPFGTVHLFFHKYISSFDSGLPDPQRQKILSSSTSTIDYIIIYALGPNAAWLELKWKNHRRTRILPALFVLFLPSAQPIAYNNRRESPV